MKISVICLSDRRDRLPVLVWSIVAQTYIDWEVIVLDHRHKLTPLLLPSDLISSKVRYVKCAYHGDWGQTVKAEAALKYATGDILLFPNDDSYYMPIALEELQSIISEGSDIALCGWIYDVLGYISMPPSTLEGHVDVGGFAIRRDFFLKVGWNDKSQTGDAKLIRDCVRAGARVGSTDKILYVKN